MAITLYFWLYVQSVTNEEHGLGHKGGQRKVHTCSVTYYTCTVIQYDKKQQWAEATSNSEKDPVALFPFLNYACPKY